MKIAIIHFRLLHLGGLESRLFNYMNYFIKKGCEVTLIVAKKNHDIGLPPEVKTVILPSLFPPKSCRVLYFSKKVQNYLKNNPFDFSLSLGRTVGQDAVIVPGNHLGFLKAMKLRGKRLTDFVQIHLDRKAFSETPLLLSCSEMMKKELSKLYPVDPNKITVLYPPTDSDKFYPPTSEFEKSELRKKLGLPKNKKIFFFLSSSHKRKGLSLLLKAFSLLKDEAVHLVIGGTKTRQKLPPNVSYAGFISNSRNYYVASDFLIHPALYEPFGQVVTESLFCGTPVLISDMVGAKEILTPELGRVIECENINQWVETIKSIKAPAFNIPLDYRHSSGLNIQSHMEKMFSNLPLEF